MDVPQMAGNPMQSMPPSMSQGMPQGAPVQEGQMSPTPVDTQTQENPQDTASQEQSLLDQLDSIDKADQMDGAGVDPSTLPPHVLNAPDPIEAHLAHIEEQLAAIDQADQMHELAQGPGLQQIIEQSNQSMQETMGGYTQVVSDNITQGLEHVATGIASNNSTVVQSVSDMASRIEDAITFLASKETTEQTTQGISPTQFSTFVKEIKSSIEGLSKAIKAQSIDFSPITDGINSLKMEESKPEKIDLKPFIAEMKSAIDSLPSKMPQPQSPDMDAVVSALKKVQSSIENIKFPIQKGGTSGGRVVTNLKLGGSDENWKDDTFYGDDVTSGIGSVAIRVWDGAGYDRVPGNAVSGMAINISQSPFQKLIDEAGAPATTYVGQSAAGTAQGTAAWTIERITVSGTTTTIQHATGTWTGRAALSYT